MIIQFPAHRVVPQKVLKENWRDRLTKEEKDRVCQLVNCLMLEPTITDELEDMYAAALQECGLDEEEADMIIVAIMEIE